MIDETRARRSRAPLAGGGGGHLHPPRRGLHRPHRAGGRQRQRRRRRRKPDDLHAGADRGLHGHRDPGVEAHRPSDVQSVRELDPLVAGPRHRGSAREQRELFHRRFDAPELPAAVQPARGHRHHRQRLGHGGSHGARRRQIRLRQLRHRHQLPGRERDRHLRAERSCAPSRPRPTAGRSTATETTDINKVYTDMQGASAARDDPAGDAVLRLRGDHRRRLFLYRTEIGDRGGDRLAGKLSPYELASQRSPTSSPTVRRTRRCRTRRRRTRCRRPRPRSAPTSTASWRRRPAAPTWTAR